MPTTRTENEPTKKHGDKLEPLIDETQRNTSPDETGESIDDDSADLQDDDDEDIENDDAEDRRDVDQRD